MKKRILISVIVAAAVLLVLFLPYHCVSYDDGGTRTYGALVYKVVKWDRPISVINEEGVLELKNYNKTSVYWFPHNFKSYNELWEMEYPS